jgi:glycerol-3-phosphate dehydrogenase
VKKIYDVIIIGGGIVGCATARALSRYDLDILLVERESDVAGGATKANSGILHAGYDSKPGTLKAALNVRGLHMYRDLVKELAIPCRANGSLVVSATEGGTARLRELYSQGVANGVTGMELLSAGQAHGLEPNLRPSVNGALRAATAGIISPYEAAIAFAESAAVNGVEFMLDTAVTGVEMEADDNDRPDRSHIIRTFRGDYISRVVINAAGVESGKIANPPVAVAPQRGQYYLLDNTQRDLVTRTIFQLPTHLGKGVLVVPTVDYNILIGPTAEESADTETTREGLEEAVRKAGLTLSFMPMRDKITAFAGIRAKHPGGDFIVEETLPGFIEAIGIDSPGLTAAPAIAEYIAEMAAARLQPEVNHAFIKERPAIKRLKEPGPATWTA